MLQASEYQPADYLAWLHRTSDFRRVMKRRSLDYTAKVKALLLVLLVLIVLDLLAIAAVALNVLPRQQAIGIISIIGLIGLLPWVLAYVILLPLVIGQKLVQEPRQRRLIAAAAQKLSSHPAKKIAIAGSFGKTTAKEVLATVLAEGMKVAATPGNMNTPIGTSRFIDSLEGDEDVIVFELGESHVGDVKKLCALIRPGMGIITGANEAHLSTFRTLERTVGTIFELEDYLGARPLYKNAESKLVAGRIRPGDKKAYTCTGTDGWEVTEATADVNGTSLVVKNGERTVAAHVGLLGLHNVGVLSAVIAIASSLGLTDAQIAEGLAKVRPFEHRMEPRALHGAWIIDDTYNGNSEGVTAGLSLLSQLEATRRIYVTPGLVEQGSKTQEVHERIGRQAARVADVVVLMRNSVTGYIVNGLEAAGFKGKVDIIDDPLSFYAGLEHYIVAGDVVLMQNDWTDNYG